MTVNPSEITKLLKDQIKNFGEKAEVSEIGKVLSVGDGIARVYGLDNVLAGEMVEFEDKSTLAQLSNPDMSVPIAFGLSWPSRKSNQIETIDWNKIKQLSFYSVDTRKFPAIDIARNVLAKGPTAGMILNTANEIAVEAFLNNKIKFVSIPKIVEKTLNKTSFYELNSIKDVIEADIEAREYASKIIKTESN